MTAAGSSASSTTRVDAADAFALLSDLTLLLLRWSYEGTTEASRIVARVGDHLGVDASATFLADSAFLTVDGRSVAFSASPTVPPLDQASALKRLLQDLDAGACSAAEAHTRIGELSTAGPRFSAPWVVVGMAAFSAGFGVSIQATWQEVVASAVLGVLVGILYVATQGRGTWELLTPFLGSVLVSTLVLVAFKQDWFDGGPIQLIIPSLFIFIPGDGLSAAMLELADGRITAGTTRLVSSLASLLMLGFGALIATVLVNVPADTLFDVDVDATLGPWWTWIGWTLFAVGVLLVFSMDPKDFPWALGFILGTAAVAMVGSLAFGEAVGTFVGAVAMTVCAAWLGRRPSMPPPYVLYLGAFYVLTPGSHGLRGIESWIGGDEIQGVTDVATMLGLLTAIALGMLVGAAFVRRPPTAGI